LGPDFGHEFGHCSSPKDKPAHFAVRLDALS
jgi:hypothetical protein